MEQADGKLTDEAAPQDRDAISDAHVCETDRMKRDRCDCREGSRFQRDATRDLRAKVRRNAHDLCVVGVSATRACDGVADIEPRDGLTNFDDFACRAVADRNSLFQLSLDGLVRRADPFRTRPIDDLPGEVRSFTRLREQRLLRESHPCTLRAGTDR